MESKKINQLATEMSPAISDLTIIGDPITGVSKKITLLQIADLFQTTGTVTSVAVTETGDALSITGSPITTAGTINIGFAGSANQYVRGDGALAPFPTTTGGGSSVSYYLNGSVNQGTFGGSTYYQMSKDAVIGVGTNFSTSSNGLIAQFITDANDPDVVQIPSGNWNIEFFMNVSASSGALASFYVEIYKYNGSTFTLLATNSATPEELTNTTTVDAYYTSVAMPTSALSVTDRLAIRIYANVASKTVTLYTEDNRLCQVVTTFSKGLASLNNLTDQSQYLATGTSGTDFAIVSSGDTHTFNLPVASAANTGKLSSTDWSTFNGKVPYTGATANVDLGNFNFDANNISGAAIIAKLNGPTSSPFVLKSGSSGYTIGDDAISLVSSPNFANTLILASNIGVVTKTALIGLGSLTATRTYTLPDITGTLALLEGSQTFTGTKTFNNAINAESGVLLKNGFTTYSNSYTSLGGNIGNLIISGSISGTPFDNELAFTPSTSNTYTFPNATGTVALTSNLSSYVPYSGATQSVNLGGFALTASALNITNTSTLDGNILLKKAGIAVTTPTYVSQFAASSGVGIGYSDGTGGANFVFPTAAIYNYTFPAASGTLALTSDLGGYVTLATAQTISGAKTFSSSPIIDNGTSGIPLRFKQYASTNFGLAGYTDIIPIGANILAFAFGQTGADTKIAYFSAASLTNNVPQEYTLPNATGTIALTSNLSAYLPLTGGTLTGALSGTSATFRVNADRNLAIKYDTHITLSGQSDSGAPESLRVYADTFRLFTATTAAGLTERLTIASTGAATFSSSVTAGSTSAGANVNVYSSSYGNNGLLQAFGTDGVMKLQMGALGNSEAFIFANTGCKLSLFSGGSTTMTLTSGGNVGIGTSSPSGAAGLALVLNSGASQGRICIKTSATGDASGDGLQIGMSGTSAFIEQRENDDLTFATNASERMRITSGGNVLINSSSVVGSDSRLNVHGPNAGPTFSNDISAQQTLLLWNKGTSGDNLWAEFHVGTSLGTKGSIDYNRGSNVTRFNTTSDANLKNIIGDSNKEKSIEILNSTKIKEYTWKEDITNKVQIGVIAQELYKTFKGAVTVGSNEELLGTEDYKNWGVDKTAFTFHLIAGWQKHQEIIANLEARIKQLENK